MKDSLLKILQGYKVFREKYATGDQSIMRSLSHHGQKPEVMVIACCDSRVDPALILQCDPGDLFVVRNVANIVPPYEVDDAHHGTSAALEFGVRFLEIKHLILLGHSQCGGIQTLLNSEPAPNDFISNWVSMVKTDHTRHHDNADEYAKIALTKSFDNCLTFPWLKEKIDSKQLSVHLWFFDIESGQILTYADDRKGYFKLENIE